MTSMFLKSAAAVAFAASLFAAPAMAQEDEQGWSGEGSFSAGTTTGNTDTTDLGLGVKLKNKTGVWTFGGEANVDYGEIDGLESRNRAFVAAHIDRQINDRLFGFVRGSYEVDQFTGFDSRAFAGGGLGYEVIDTEQMNWDVRGGPGIKIDEVKRIVTTDANGAPLIIPAETETSIAAIGKSDFSYAFNDSVTFTNVTDVLYAQESTQLGNTVALTASLTDSLSARVSFDVRHDTNPPQGFKATDTATKIAVVYGF